MGVCRRGWPAAIAARPATLALVISGGPCALLAACALRRADVLVVEAPQRCAAVHFVPTRALELLPPDAAAALRARGSAPPDGGVLCVDDAVLSATLRSCLPASALVDGRVTGFTQQAGEVHVRLEGRAGRRSQRSVTCAALLGAGGASCSVRAALLGASPIDRRVGLWRGVCAVQADDDWPTGTLELARDADGACVGAAVKHGQSVFWSLLAPPQPPRATLDASALAALAQAAARWPLLAAVVAQTRAQHVSCELVREPQHPLRGQSGVLLLGYAARGIPSAAMDELSATVDDVLMLMQALFPLEALKYTPDDLAAALNAYATASFHG